MKPTWQSDCGKIKLYHGDCQKIEFPSEATVISDPPYNIGKPKLIQKYKNRDSGKYQPTTGHDFGADFDTDAIKPSDWASRMSEVVITFYSMHAVVDLFKAFSDAGYDYKQGFYWCKSNFIPPLRGCTFAWTVNTGFIFVKQGSKLQMNKEAGVSPNFFVTPVCSGKERTSHSTQKPISVMNWLVRHLTKSDRLVIDPFMGSGTTGVAAALFGRDFIGVEQKEEYFKISVQRIKKALRRRSASFQID